MVPERRERNVHSPVLAAILRQSKDTAPRVDRQAVGHAQVLGRRELDRDLKEPRPGLGRRFRLLVAGEVRLTSIWDYEAGSIAPVTQPDRGRRPPHRQQETRFYRSEILQGAVVMHDLYRETRNRQRYAFAVRPQDRQHELEHRRVNDEAGPSPGSNPSRPRPRGDHNVVHLRRQRGPCLEHDRQRILETHRARPSTRRRFGPPIRGFTQALPLRRPVWVFDRERSARESLTAYAHDLKLNPPRVRRDGTRIWRRGWVHRPRRVEELRCLVHFDQGQSATHERIEEPLECIVPRSPTEGSELTAVPRVSQISGKSLSIARTDKIALATQQPLLWTVCEELRHDAWCP